MSRMVWAALTASLACVGLAAGHVIPGFKVTAAPTIDGVVDLGKEWAGVPSAKGFVLQTDGKPSPDDTVFWLAYDAKYVYFAAKMADPAPKLIKANAHPDRLRGDPPALEFRASPIFKVTVPYEFNL